MIPQDETVPAARASRRALVTGASTGLGAVFASTLARQGYDLVIVARNEALLEALAGRLHDSHGCTVQVIAADLTRPAALRAVEMQLAHDGAFDLLINNAGFGTVGPFATLDPEREAEEIQLNVVALMRLTRAALPGMIARGYGGIINVSSMSAFVPGPYDATYGATKAFVNSFTESLHEELRGTGVRVQALCPGFTYTEFQQRAGIDVSAVPAFVWMTPEAVVEASLAALQRGHVVCVPGLGNRLLAWLISAAPRALVRRVTGLLARRVLGH